MRILSRPWQVCHVFRASEVNEIRIFASLEKTKHNMDNGEKKSMNCFNPILMLFVEILQSTVIRLYPI